jgi:negative regulator of replication initiation
MLTAMARELVENKGIGESAESIWRNLAELYPATIRTAEAESAMERPSATAADAKAFEAPVTPEPVPDSSLVEDIPRRSGKPERATQLSLF